MRKWKIWNMLNFNLWIKFGNSLKKFTRKITGKQIYKNLEETLKKLSKKKKRKRIFRILAKESFFFNFFTLIIRILVSKFVYEVK